MSERRDTQPMNWPSPGDKPFAPDLDTPGLRANTSPDFMRLIMSDDSGVADGFKEAADLIVDTFDTEGSRAPESFYLPVAFLYRHCIELNLKDLLRTATCLGLVRKSKNLEEDLGRHDLRRLWNRLRPALEKFFPDGDVETLQSAEKVILDFHIADPGSTTFRYARDRNGQESLRELHRELGFQPLRQAVDGLSNFFLGCCAAFDNALENCDC